MIKLEPDIDTRYYGENEHYAMRPQVKMEEGDDDYYANYEEDDDYFPPPKVCVIIISVRNLRFVKKNLNFIT